jgi:hypothetical protein
MIASMKQYICRIGMLTVCVLLCFDGLAQSIPIYPERHGDHLSVAAPQFHFISGKAVRRLQNGSTITYALQLSIVPEKSKKQTFQLLKQFMVSYDLWEEKYSVAGLPDGGSASRLAADNAEAWCLENIAIPIRSIPEREPFMIRLECSINEDIEKENGERSGQIFADLVEIFSRKKKEPPQRWETVAGPFRLENLKSSR